MELLVKGAAEETTTSDVAGVSTAEVTVEASGVMAE
jgi:hypothetical protein